LSKEYIEKLKILTAENTGVDGETQENLKPKADQALAAVRSLENCANREAQRLKRHPRVTDPIYEVRKMHCGLLRAFFNDFAHPGYRSGTKAQERVRNFNIELPARRADLDKLIETDTPENLPPWRRHKMKH
jgi:hypothetical protein